jgi:hypothetical protein
MQPSNDQQQGGGWPPPGGGTYARPTFVSAPPAVSTTRARPWLIGLAAMSTVLVLILAIDNSTVASKVQEHTVNSSTFVDRALFALTNFRWDLGRLSNDFAHIYLAALMTDIAIVVLVFLFVTAVTRGRGSFGHVFAGTWIAVIAAAMVAGYVRPLVLDIGKLAPQSQGKATNIFFSVYSPSANTLFAAIVFGLVAALVAGLVGVASRRTDVITAPPVRGVVDAPVGDEPTPATREPWSAPPAAAPGPITNPSPWSTDSPPESGVDSDRTTQLPALGDRTPSDGEQHTTELPRTEDDRA